MSEIKNVVIIGGGPAGNTAAIYAGRANLNPIMYEGFMAWGLPAGWQLLTTTFIENFPWFPENITWGKLMHNMKEQAKNSGAEVITKTVDKVDFSSHPFKITIGNEEVLTKTVIISTGATAKKLKIKGGDNYWNRGISGCAVCDGALPIFKDKHLVVVGGGDVAMEEALHLVKYGSKVSVLVRSDSLKASKAMQEKALKNEKIEFLWNTEVIEAIGDERVLQKIKIINNKTNEEKEIEAWGLFYAIGHTPNTWFLDGQVDMDESWYILTKAGTTQTSVAGVFAAGDVQDKEYRQAVTAAGTGCMAALDAERYLAAVETNEEVSA